MHKLRFNAFLLVVILVFGVGAVALREASGLSENGLLALTLGALLVSILLTVHHSGAKRAFWNGFALFG